VRETRGYEEREREREREREMRRVGRISPSTIEGLRRRGM